MSYIDKIKKGSDTYDIQDARITPTAQDEGKVLAANSTGGLEFITTSSGTKLYAHKIAPSYYGGAGSNAYLVFITKSSTKYSSVTTLFNLYRNTASQGDFVAVKLVYDYSDITVGGFEGAAITVA